MKIFKLIVITLFISISSFSQNIDSLTKAARFVVITDSIKYYPCLLFSMRTEIGVRNLMYQSFTTQTFKSLRKHKSFYFSFYTIDTDDDISANPDFTSPFEGKENQKQVLFIGKTQRRIHIKPGKDIRYYKLLNNPIVIPYSKEIENKIIQSLK